MFFFITNLPLSAIIKLGDNMTQTTFKILLGYDKEVYLKDFLFKYLSNDRNKIVHSATSIELPYPKYDINSSNCDYVVCDNSNSLHEINQILARKISVILLLNLKTGQIDSNNLDFNETVESYLRLADDVVLVDLHHINQDCTLRNDAFNFMNLYHQQHQLKYHQEVSQYLVYLSNGITNTRVVREAAKSALANGAKLTALCILNPTESKDSFDQKMQEDINLAQQLGAQIVVLNGDDQYFQLIEYAKARKISKVFIGDVIKTTRFFKRKSLSETLAENLNNIVVITVLEESKEKPSIKWKEMIDARNHFNKFFIVFSILAFTTLINWGLMLLGVQEVNIAFIYILSVISIALLVRGFLWAIIASFD